MKTQQKTNQADMNVDYLGNQGQQGIGERAQGGQQGGQDRPFRGGIDQASGKANEGAGGRAGEGASGRAGGSAGENASGSAGSGDDSTYDVEYVGSEEGLDGEVVGQAIQSDEDDKED